MKKIIAKLHNLIFRPPKPSEEELADRYDDLASFEDYDYLEWLPLWKLIPSMIFLGVVMSAIRYVLNPNLKVEEQRAEFYIALAQDDWDSSLLSSVCLQ